MTQSKTLVSRHPYRTRATVRKIEDLEKSQEVVKADISAMKEQMVTIMEALNLIKNKLENSNSLTEEGISLYPMSSYQGGVKVQNTNTQGNIGAQVFPGYGLPPGYTSPTAEYSKEPIGQMNVIAAQVNEEPVDVQGTTNHKLLPHTMNANMIGSQMISPPKITPRVTGDGTQIRSSPHVVVPETMLEDIKISDKLEILEERLRAIEG